MDVVQTRPAELEVTSPPAHSCSPTGLLGKQGGNRTYASSDATTASLTELVSPLNVAAVSSGNTPQGCMEPQVRQTQTPSLPVTAEHDVAQEMRAAGDLKPQTQPVVDLTEETNTCFGVSGSMFDIEDMLGEGSFGAVYRCRHRQDPEESPQEEPSFFAVKVMDATRLAMLTGYPVEVLCPRLRREVEILFHLGEQHPGVLRLHQAFFSQSSHKFYLVTELLRGGDLFNAIVARGKPFNETEGRAIFLQIVEAVEFCHSMGVAHRDLKLENCLFVEKGSLKVRVCDFGQAKILSGDGLVETAQTLTTTPQYTAPEVASAVQAHQTYDAFKADAFGLGVMLYALLCCALPDAARGTAYERHRHWSRLSPEAQTLIRTLLNPDPRQRPLPKDVKKHPWLARAELVEVKTPPSTLRTPDDLNSKLVIEALIGVQEWIGSLQRERGTACWALGGDEGESKLHWQRKVSIEKQDTACQRIVNVMQRGGNTKAWVGLSTEVCNVQKEIKKLRKECEAKIEQRDDCLDAQEDMQDVLGAYTALIMRLIEALNGSFSLLGGTAAASGGTSLLMSDLKLRFLQLAGEQLARERGIIAGHLVRPGTIRSAGVFRQLAEIIGARKVLLGTAEKNVPLIGGGVSLATTLGIVQGSLIDASDMASLEAVEDRAMSGKKVDLLTVSEWWHHLTKAVDKVHQHMMVGIVDHIAPGTPSVVGAL